MQDKLRKAIVRFARSVLHVPDNVDIMVDVPTKDDLDQLREMHRVRCFPLACECSACAPQLWRNNGKYGKRFKKE